MKRQVKGFSLNGLSEYYDLMTPAEKSKFRRRQIALMDIREGEKVLDVGCGTGVLSILSKLSVGETGEVEGIDIASQMIAKARQKADRAKLKIGFKVASIDALPYPDNYFDLIISSMMFHHLPVETKKKGIEEVYRVLKDEGRFFLCDFFTPGIVVLPLIYFMFIWTSSTRYQLLGKLPGLIGECGFKTMELKRKGSFLEYYLVTKQ